MIFWIYYFQSIFYLINCLTRVDSKWSKQWYLAQHLTDAIPVIMITSGSTLDARGGNRSSSKPILHDQRNHCKPCIDLRKRICSGWAISVNRGLYWFVSCWSTGAILCQFQLQTQTKVTNPSIFNPWSNKETSKLRGPDHIEWKSACLTLQGWFWVMNQWLLPVIESLDLWSTRDWWITLWVQPLLQLNHYDRWSNATDG